MTYAQIINGVVAFVCRVDPAGIFPPAFAATLIEAPDTVEPGWTFDGSDYAAPVVQPPAPEAIPQVVSRAQFILALLEIGLLDEVEAVIEQADRATQINYRERLEFERDFPLISTMAAVLGKTDAEIDALFLLAATK